MVQLKVISTGSKGNSYALCFGNEILLIELGIKFKDILKSIDFKFKNIVGCVVSHTHKDHSLGTKEALERGLKVYSNKNMKEEYKNISLIANKTQIGSFLVTPIKLFHDVECFGYLIENDSMGRLVFATDTDSIPYRFKNINHFMIESNYSESILKENAKNDKLNDFLCDRIRNSHLSLEKACDFLNANKDNPIRNIILIHPSDLNSDIKLFKEKIKETIKTLNYDNINVADNGEIYEVNKNVF